MNLECHGHIDMINDWHARARPEPTVKDFDVQLGCHFEEIAECEDVLLWKAEDDEDVAALQNLRKTLTRVADGLKKGRIEALIHNREEFLDSLCDQIVTAVGVAHCADMDVVGALAAVDQSNWSKYVDGKPVFDANGKITKGPDYVKPDLTGCY